MTKVIIGNSSCQVTGLNEKQLKELRKLMSYEADPAASWHSGTFRSSTRHLCDKLGRFPTGLLRIFYVYCHKNMVKFVTNDTRIRPVAKPGMFKLELK